MRRPEQGRTYIRIRKKERKKKKLGEREMFYVGAGFEAFPVSATGFVEMDMRVDEAGEDEQVGVEMVVLALRPVPRRLHDTFVDRRDPSRLH